MWDTTRPVALVVVAQQENSQFTDRYTGRTFPGYIVPIRKPETESQVRERRLDSLISGKRRAPTCSRKWSPTTVPFIRKGTRRNSSWPGELTLHKQAEYICADLPHRLSCRSLVELSRGHTLIPPRNRCHQASQRRGTPQLSDFLLLPGLVSSAHASGLSPLAHHGHLYATSSKENKC
jgi:hypothetical protein